MGADICEKKYKITNVSNDNKCCRNTKCNSKTYKYFLKQFIITFFFSCDSFFIILNLSELKLFFIFSMFSRYLNCNIVSVLNSFFLLAALRVTTTAAPVVSTTYSLHTSKYIYAQNSVKEVKLNSRFTCFHASGHIADFSKIDMIFYSYKTM